jgi:hypothetical protein
MNTLSVGVSAAIHYTEAEIPARSSQVRRSTLCSKRTVTGYVQAPGTAEVNCPKCLAKAAS